MSAIDLPQVPENAMETNKGKAAGNVPFPSNLNPISGGSGCGCYAQYTDSESVFNTQLSSDW